MMMLKRFSLLAAALVPIALGLVPSAASARIVELGATTPLAKPACPPNTPPAKCFIVLTRTTAVQSKSDGVVDPTAVKRPGWIVAFSVGLAQLSNNIKTEKSFLHQLDVSFGGTPQVAITVLKPGPKHKFTVVAETPLFHVLPYLGQLLQLPLSAPPNFTQFKPLAVKPGEVIGLTVPTWAPVLSYNLTSNQFGLPTEPDVQLQERRGSGDSTAVGQQQHAIPLHLLRDPGAVQRDRDHGRAVPEALRALTGGRAQDPTRPGDERPRDERRASSRRPDSAGRKPTRVRRRRCSSRRR